jgi:uncharacterized protein YjbI with pentapeptide repeats
MAKNKLSQYDLFNSKVALDAMRDGGKVVSTRIIERVFDYSQPEQLSKGQRPAVEIVAVDRFMLYNLDNGKSLKYSSGTGEAYFSSNGIFYRIRPLTAAERAMYTPEDGDGETDDSEDDREALVAGALSFLGGNSVAARRARAKVQRRDRRGRFAEMGGGFTVSIRGLDGSFSAVSGKVVGSSGDDDIEVQVDNPMGGLPKGIYVFPSTKGTAAKAILSDEAFEDAPNVDLDQVDFEKEDSFVDAADVKIIDTPTEWEEIEQGKHPYSVFRSKDGYFVRVPKEQENDPFSSNSWEVHRPNFYTADDGEPDGWADKGDQIFPEGFEGIRSWAQVQSLIAADLESAEADAKEALEFIQGEKKPIKPVSPAKSETAGIDTALSAAQSVTDEQRDAFKSIGDVMRNPGIATKEERASKIRQHLLESFDKAVFKDKNGKDIRIELAEMPEDGAGWFFADLDTSGAYGGDIEHQLYFSGDFVDAETGETLGTFGRTVLMKANGDLAVKHDILILRSEHQSRGIGSVFNTRSEFLYREAGVDEVNLLGSSKVKKTAKDDTMIGATHWGRNGFDWETEDDRLTHIQGARDAIEAWRSGTERTDSFGTPYFDSDSQVDDLEALVNKASQESFDDPFRHVAGDLVRWPGADSWFAHHAYVKGTRDDTSDGGSGVSYSKRFTPKKETKAPEPEKKYNPLSGPPFVDPDPDVPTDPFTGDKVSEDVLNNTKWKGTVPPLEEIVPGADLSGAMLSGMDLSGMNLKGVNLSDALLNNVNLTDVELSGATLDRAQLKYANLTNATLDDVTGVGAVFDKALFDGTKIKRGSFGKSSFEMCTFKSAALDDVTFSKCNFNFVNFGQYTTAKMVYFRECGMQNFSTYWANIDGSTFKQCDMRGSRFDNGIIQNTDFVLSDLSMSTFVKLSLNDSEFVQCDVTEVNFDQIGTNNVQFSKTMKSTNFTYSGQSMQGVTGLSLNAAIGMLTDITGWKRVGGQQGSNDGGTYEDKDGGKHYVKMSRSETHAQNESLASNLYGLAGIRSISVNVAKMNEQPATFSPIVKSDSSGKTLLDAVNSGDTKVLDEIREGFVVDAWLSNWDVAGLTFDNMIIGEDGRPVRVDPGGALMFRAQGEPKGEAFGDVVSEIDSLRDPNINRQSAALFADVTDEQIIRGVMRVARISPEQIQTLVDSIVSDPDTAALVATRLKNRREYLMERFGVTEEAAFNAGSNVETRGRGEKIGGAEDESSPWSKPYNMSLSPHPLMQKSSFRTPATDFAFYIPGTDDEEASTKTVDIAALKYFMSVGFDVNTGVATEGAIRGKLAFMNDADIRAEVATLLSLNMLDEAVLYLRGIRAGIEEHDPGDQRNLKGTIDSVYNSLLEADFTAFGVEDIDDGVVDDYLMTQVFEALSEGKPEYDVHLYEALRATPEEIVKKLSTYPREEIDRAGVPRFVDNDPLSFGESDFQNVKPIMEALRSVTKTKRSKEDSLADGIDIEDGVVTFYKKAYYSGAFFYGVEPGFGSRPRWMKIRNTPYGAPTDPPKPDAADRTVAAMRYKLTSWALEGLIKQIDSEGASSKWSLESNMTGIERGTLGEDGFVYVNSEDIEKALPWSGGSSTKTYKYVDPDGRFTITINTGVQGQYYAANGAVDVTFSSLDPSEADIKDALKIAGVADPRPARKQDMRTLAENRLISIFGGFVRKRAGSTIDSEIRNYLGNDYSFSDSTKNPSGKGREMILKILKDEYDLSADDIEIFVGENGLVEMRLSDAGVEVFMDETGVKSFHHSVYADAQTAYDTAEKVVTLLLGSEDGSIVPGLQSTNERFRSGKQLTGMSSSQDMNSGGADYVYLGAGEAPAYGMNKYSVYLQYKAEKIFRRGEIFANRTDMFGARGYHDDIVGEISQNTYETMVKRHLGPEAIDKVFVSKEVKAEIIERLKRFGITTMYGVPIQDFFVAEGS